MIPKKLVTDTKNKIHRAKTGLAFISSHLSDVKKTINQSKLEKDLLDKIVVSEMKALQPLLKEVEKQRKRIIALY